MNVFPLLGFFPPHLHLYPFMWLFNHFQSSLHHFLFSSPLTHLFWLSVFSFTVSLMTKDTLHSAWHEKQSSENSICSLHQGQGKLRKQPTTSGLRLTSSGGGGGLQLHRAKKTSQVVLPVSELLGSHLSRHRWWLPQKVSSYSKSHRHGPARRGKAAGTFPSVFVLLGLGVLTSSSPTARRSKNKTATRLLPLYQRWLLECWKLFDVIFSTSHPV